MLFWILAAFLAALCAYLFGSINFAVIISKKMYGEDIRAKDSGNAGMTNILRNYGKKAAALTFIGDFLKGVAAVFAGRALFLLLLGADNMFYGAYIGAIFAILGHLFPLFFGFKGGKGVAVSGGVIFALNPIIAIILISIFLIVTLISKMVSLGAIVGMSFYPVFAFIFATWVYGQNAVFSTIFAAIVSGFVIFMHRENIKRIKAGTERKIGQKKKEDTAQEESNRA